jgi:hypothetical protein
MKIIFSNREQFEKSIDIIFNPNTRCSSTGNLDIGYADMIFSFSDEYHGNCAVQRLRLAGVSDFSVEKA